MTAQSVASRNAPGSTSPGGLFLGFGTVFRKEVTEWVRGRGPRRRSASRSLGAAFMTLIPFIAEATGKAESAGLLSKDPTVNVLSAGAARRSP